VVLVAGTAGCVTPARNDPQYRGKAVAAVQAASSSVATGLLVVQQDRQKKVLGPYADEVVTASETSMGSISESFGSVQPPDPQADRVRDTVTDVLSKAQDALAHTRIAIRRSDQAGLAGSEAELRSVAKALDKAEQDLG
jgi:hypothetical protein